MEMKNQTLLVALIFLLLPMLVFAQSNSNVNSTLNSSSNSTLNTSAISPAVSNATVARNCSFVLVLNALPAYERIGNLTINYTLQKKTSNNCTVDTISGNVVIMQLDNSNVILTQNLTAQNVTESPSTRNVILGTDQFANTSYSATVAFNFDGKVSSSSKQFTLYNPQNLTLSSLNPHFSLTQSSPITFRFGTINIGQYTSGNFTLFVNITSFTDTAPIFQGEYNQTSLLPFQNATYSITIPNATQEVGGYRVSAYETYKVANQTRTSNIAASLYSVQEQLGAAGGSNSNQFTDLITPIQGLQITTAPLMTSVALGTPAFVIVGLQNTGNVKENVKLSLPGAFSSFMSLSTGTFYMSPGQESTLQVYVNANQTVSPGTYIVPIVVDLNVSNRHTIKTEYFSLNIYEPETQNLQVVNQVTLKDNMSSATGILQLANPLPVPVTNFTLQTFIPSNMISNASDIVTTGLAASISNTSQFYIITWRIPQLNAMTTVYGYYVLNNSVSQPSLQKIQNVMAIPSAPSQASILKVVNIAFPTFYTNSTSQIPVFVLYTGKSSQQVSFTMTGPTGITIHNFSQVISASPNQLLSPVFDVSTSQTPGTYLVNLYISTQGFNTTYTLPLIVLSSAQQSAPSGPTTTTNSPFFFIQVGNQTLPIFGVSGIFVIIAVIVYLIRKYSSRPRYNRETSEQLVRLREQIKRSEKDK